MHKNFFFVALLLIIPVSTLFAGDYFIVKIIPESGRTQQVINKLNLDAVNEGYAGQVEIVADQADIDRLVQEGIPFQVVRPLSTRYIPDYQSYEDVNDLLNLWHSSYPDITEIIEIGVSAEMGLPIYGIKISDNAADREDETVVWIDGVHHAREPMGMMSCMVLIEHLLTNYGIDSLSTRMVNELETWIIPILNPDGYKYFIESTTYTPWWRKNQRDNNSNGQFDSNYDGVDLNRNYDSDWQNSSSGSTDPASWVYRGLAPFSETEVAAKKYWVEYLRPIAAITYHSFGEIIYYKSGINGHETSETVLIDAFAQQMAMQIPTLNGSGLGYYNVGRSLWEAPMSYYWMYEKVGVWEMLVETGVKFVPKIDTAAVVADDNLGGVLFVLEKSMEGPGIRGHVYSTYDSSALDAEVQITEYWNPGMTPRRTDPSFGHFNRFTWPGTFNLTFAAVGYLPDSTSIAVPSDDWAQVEIYLEPYSLISIDQITVNDDSSGASQGNADGIPNNGERLEFRFTLTNHGARLSGPVMLELEIDDPYVTLEDSVQFIAPIESDSSVDDIMAFAVNVAPDCPNQHQFDVT
ncbi:MAG: hypothetical protein KAK01_11510, partial [Candidatus Marinimicrobia bacterium]|nr:hypothetical protein [Candidatus Neomarinimicrobiota bacterium]